MDAEKSVTDDALYALLKIREESKKKTKGDAWSKPDTPAERLENYNKQFSSLKLEDFLRGYTDRSAECRYSIPTEEELDGILRESDDDVETAIQLCLYCMKAQLFNDGNKRAAVIVANHYMIAHGQGLLVIPESVVPEFKRLLVAYYEDRDNGEITAFLREKCWRKF